MSVPSDNPSGFEWLLQQQRQAVLEHKQSKRQEPPPGCSAGQDAPPERPPKKAKTAGEVLLQAVADGRSDIAAYMVQQGVRMEDAPPPTRAAATAEAFIATLLQAAAQGGQQAGSFSSEQQQEQQEQQEQLGQGRAQQPGHGSGPSGAGVGPSGAAAQQQEQRQADSDAGAEGAAEGATSSVAAGRPAAAPQAHAAQPSAQQPCPGGSSVPPHFGTLHPPAALPRPVLDQLKCLLGLGLDSNHVRHDGMTPLLAAVVAGSVEMVRALLVAGARPDPAAEQAPAAGPEAQAQAQAQGQQGMAGAAAGSSDGAGAAAAVSGASAGEHQLQPEQYAGAGEEGGAQHAEEQQQAQHAEEQEQVLQAEQPQRGKKKGKKKKTASAGDAGAAPGPRQQPSPLALACRNGLGEICRLLLAAGSDVDRASIADLAPATLGPAAAASGGPVAVQRAAPAPAGQPAAAGGSGRRSGGQEGGSVGGGSSSEGGGGGAAQAAGVLGGGAAERGERAKEVVTPLMAAISSRDLGLVEALLEAGADVHRLADRANHRSSPLWLAVDLGFGEAVRKLVAAGACAGAKGPYISSRNPAVAALAWAAARGHVPMVELLYPRVLAGLQGGDRAMVGQLSRHEARHPLAAAAEQGQAEVVGKLLALGASVNNKGSRKGGYGGYTPLMLGAEGRHLTVVDLLLAAGARPGITNERGECAASLALQRGHLEVASRLLHASRDEEEREAQLSVMARKLQCGFAPGLAPSKQKEPPPLEQVESERAAYRAFLATLVERRDQCASGAPPSLLARAAAGSGALLDAVLSCGAPPLAGQPQAPQALSASPDGQEAAAAHAPVDWSAFDGERGSTPLLEAVWYGWGPVRRLLERGADVNQRAGGGSSLLLLVASRPGLAELGEKLLDWLGEPERQQGREAVDEQVRDAVGVAVQRRNSKFGARLLGRLQQEASGGAEVDAQAAEAAFGVLLEHKVKSLAEINTPNPATGDTLLLKQVRTATAKAVRQLLLIPGMDVNGANTKTGRTPVMAAVERRQLGILQALLGTGRADLNISDAGGATALLHAARKHNADALRILVAAGADPTLADNFGDTPLMALARGGQHKPIMQLVKGHEAALEARDADEKTALLHAAAEGRFNAAKVLRSLGADPTATDSSGRSGYELAMQNGHAEVAVLLKPGRGSAGGSGDGGGDAAGV